MRKGNLSKQATAILETAYHIAARYGYAQTSLRHLLLAFLYAPETTAGKILMQNGLLYSIAEPLLMCGGAQRAQRNTIAAELRRVIRSAAAEAASENRAVTPEQLLMSMIRDRDGRALIIQCGAQPDCIFTGLVTVFREPERQEKRETELRLTEQFARDLAEKAAMGDPVIGRQRELDELIRILCRKNKNNPALVGEPGVGKTAIVEELARRIASGCVPEQLAGKRLLSLDMASLIAGTKYRGEFEERVRDLLAEIRRAGNLIVFVDEMHTLIGAGSAEGAIDAANIIKPALGRGELQLIGATTRKEYRKYIEKDAALERRFRVVQIDEPTQAETLEVLRGLRPGLELHHRVHIGDEALMAAVTLSVRYLQERFLPDKALDLLDESAASAAMQISKDKMRVVTQQTVMQTLALRTGIPVGRISGGERDSLIQLEQQLKQSIVGQDEAVHIVASAVRRGRSGLAESGRPVAAILLAGPTGVGKTALCKALAREVYGSEHSMLRLDMSEYMERHTVSRLLGAPPGYIGHGEGGELTERVRQKPYSLLLFDELEKAHRDVTAILLQIMEDGVLTDAVGRTVSFRNTLIVMTTNAGSSLEGKSTMGFASDAGESLLMKHLREYFAPEFLSRIDAVASFRQLQEPQLCCIADRLLQQTVERARSAGVTLSVDAAAATCIGKRCSRLPGGAREIRHMVQAMVENPLADMILAENTPLHAQLLCSAGELRVLRSSAMPV